MKLHHLRPAEGSKKRKIRVGRGEAGRRGKTAGRGTKGLKAPQQGAPGLRGWPDAVATAAAAEAQGLHGTPTGIRLLW